MVLDLERDFNLNTDVIWLFLRKDCESRPECRKVQFRDFLIEVLWPEVDIETSTITP